MVQEFIGKPFKYDKGTATFDQVSSVFRNLGWPVQVIFRLYLAFHADIILQNRPNSGQVWYNFTKADLTV